MPNQPATRAQNAMGQALYPAQVDIETLVTDHYPYIQRLAYSILNDLDEAQDVVQETFISASRGLAKYRGEAGIKTWLTSIAVNACRSKLRKNKVRQILQSSLEALQLVTISDPTPENIVLQHESDVRIWHAVDELDEKHRMVVILRYVYEFPVREIALALNTNEGTVHSRLHHARQKLSRWLGETKVQAEVNDGTP